LFLSNHHILLRLLKSNDSSMRRRHEYYCDVAHNLALKSSMTQKHGCVIVYNDEIIAQGMNRQYDCMKEVDSIHAEVNAINQLRKIMQKSKDKNFIQKCKLYVVRIGTPNMDYPLKNSKPCSHCTKVIERVGIPEVYYSTDDEFYKAYELYMEKGSHHAQKGRPASCGRPISPICKEAGRPTCVVS